MILANGETLLREWTYATKKEGYEKSDCTLSVTDKRIVATEKSNRHISQQEIYNKDVKAISFNHAVKSKTNAIILIILGILIAVVGVVIGMKTQPLILIPFLLLGVILFAYGIYLLNQSAFNLIITTREIEGAYLAVGAMRILGGGRHKRAKKVKVKVEDSIVLEIIDELGALILNSNN
jgi:F0F1-type ATP synthase assembly protein I